MYQSLLQDSRFLSVLLKLDEGLAAEAQEAGCPCGGRLDRADYERKPRGGPEGVGADCARRFSFCCAVEGCRRRCTPASLRFLGRKVFFGVVVLLIPVLRDGATPTRLSRLSQEFFVSPRTIRRWRHFWRETFVASRVWAAARGLFATPVKVDAMPRSLIEAFPVASDPGTTIVSVLRLVGQAF